MSNLEVDVMEGDGFWFDLAGNVRQYRLNQSRWFGYRHIHEWTKDKIGEEEEHIDLPTFTRYCEGCGLTVKMVKPEPKVETIKPPEFGVKFENGHVALYQTRDDACQRTSGQIGACVVRIDWGVN